MEPTVIITSLLALWGLSKLISKSSGLPIVIPPDPKATWMTSGYANPPPPLGTEIMGPPYPAGLSPWGYKQLHYPMGTTIIDMVGGQLVVGRLEHHYHPPGSVGVTATGWHKGLSAYRPVAPWVQIG